MSRAAVQHVIALAAELSEDERRMVVDAIAPKDSVSSLADEWQAEIARRVKLVRRRAIFWAAGWKGLRSP